MAEFSTEQRSDLSRRGLAMPDGSFPIRNKSDLRNAISSYGRAKNPDAAKRWIIRRARELNALDMLPESWNVAQHSDILAHYGVKGMKWGVRKKRRSIPKNVREARANLDAAKANKKAARKAWNKAYRKGTSIRGAYGRNSDANAREMVRTAKASAKADRAYKTAKQRYKKSLDTKNPRYSKFDREYDTEHYGEKGAQRINRRMNKGSSKTGAQLREFGRQTLVGTARLAAFYGIASASIPGTTSNRIGRGLVTSILKRKGTKVTWLN